MKAGSTSRWGFARESTPETPLGEFMLKPKGCERARDGILVKISVVVGWKVPERGNSVGKESEVGISLESPGNGKKNIPQGQDLVTRVEGSNTGDGGGEGGRDKMVS